MRKEDIGKEEKKRMEKPCLMMLRKKEGTEDQTVVNKSDMQNGINLGGCVSGGE